MLFSAAAATFVLVGLIFVLVDNLGSLFPSANWASAPGR
jgi:hypothetical protein